MTTTFKPHNKKSEKLVSDKEWALKLKQLMKEHLSPKERFLFFMEKLSSIFCRKSTYEDHSLSDNQRIEKNPHNERFPHFKTGETYSHVSDIRTRFNKAGTSFLNKKLYNKVIDLSDKALNKCADARDEQQISLIGIYYPT